MKNDQTEILAEALRNISDVLEVITDKHWASRVSLEEVVAVDEILTETRKVLKDYETVNLPKEGN